MPEKGLPLSRRDALKLLSIGAGAWIYSACSARMGTPPPSGAAPTPTAAPELEPTSAQITDTVETPAVEPTTIPDIPGVGRLPDDFTAGRLTEVGDFYVQNTNGVAKVDPFDYRLSLNGMFETPMELTMAEIRRRPAVEIMRTLECIGNPVGGNLIGNATWKGVSLAALLKEAGLQPEAQHLLFYSADEYETSIQVSLGLAEDSLLVYEMNGEPLTAAHGNPLRLLLPGVYGQKQPKWIVSIRASERDSLGTWEKKGWSNLAEIQINSKVETPRLRQVVPAGIPFYVTGFAMADSSGVKGVDVSLDDGETWNPAELHPGPDNGVWMLWNWVWENPQPGDYVITARAEDGNGVIQEESGVFGVLDNVFPNGSSLMHSISVTVA